METKEVGHTPRVGLVRQSLLHMDDRAWQWYPIRLYVLYVSKLRNGSTRTHLEGVAVCIRLRVCVRMR